MTSTKNLMEEYHGRERPTSGLAQTRTKQFCEEMSVTKELMATLLHTAGGRGGVSLGGDGVSGELTSWDGTKKKDGWGNSR
ncbi:MAG: hypothetical protein IKO71_07445 [Bacteroidaceae bacterium]|nr:hypothetical protein [Bacteroidaceae bacterium]MBR6047010.1 hypothetical protein [Bacteroidaceae bacterium]